MDAKQAHVIGAIYLLCVDMIPLADSIIVMLSEARTRELFPGGPSSSTGPPLACAGTLLAIALAAISLWVGTRRKAGAHALLLTALAFLLGAAPLAASAVLLAREAPTAVAFYAPARRAIATCCPYDEDATSRCGWAGTDWRSVCTETPSVAVVAQNMALAWTHRLDILAGLMAALVVGQCISGGAVLWRAVRAQRDTAMWV